jgi:hypothetical protein
VARAHGAVQRFDQRLGHREIREALAQVHRLVLHGHWDITVKMVVPTFGSLVSTRMAFRCGECEGCTGQFTDAGRLR